jgi:hypothetical protein
MQLIRLVMLCSLAVSLAACGKPLPGSVSGGECKVFRAEIVETCGLTQADQDVIDNNEERGIAACRWARPQARTPTCDDLRAEIKSLHGDQPPLPPKKKALWRRILRR